MISGEGEVVPFRAVATKKDIEVCLHDAEDAMIKQLNVLMKHGWKDYN